MQEDFFTCAAGSSQLVWSETGGQILVWPELGENNIFWVPPAAVSPSGLELPASDHEGFVHGGVPLVGPWFAKGYQPEIKRLPQHGWFHLKTWEKLQEANPEAAGIESGDFKRITLKCHDPEPPVAAAYLHIAHSPTKLKLQLEVVAAADFELESAFHTYFFTPEITSTRVHGLEQVPATDASRGRKPVLLNGPLEFSDTTDLVFEAAPKVQLETQKHRVAISPSAASRTIVWNPWGHIAGWKNYVCVETAVSEGGAIQLQAGQRHQLEVCYSLTS